jgi:hypothetical protein
MIQTSFVIAACLTLIAFSTATASDEGELAKATQKPLADLIELPFKNNINFVGLLP